MNAFSRIREFGDTSRQNDCLPDYVRQRIERAEDERQPRYSRPSSATLQDQFSCPELHFVAHVSEVFDQDRRETQSLIHGVCCLDGSVHICGIARPRGLFRHPSELPRLRPSRVPGLPPEIDLLREPKHRGDALEAILTYIDVVFTPMRPPRYRGWL